MKRLNNNSANKMVRECIFTSLMILMKKKEYQDITITDITNKAGVSRMAYYRNYSSKENIITDYLDELFEKYLEEISNYKHIDAYVFAYKFFEYFRQHRELIENLNKANLSVLILNKFDGYLLSIFEKILYNDGPKSSSKYAIQFLAGGLYKVLIEWVESGLKENDEEMAIIIKERVENITWR
ncbi:TetR/AcrR family transcriptional regulator [Fervidibacillus albus]|uniref:TetR/AcrR family transcriptional regulator n=1 Tax=Fervidibacillus albus TaxID=2980026 RepID=A0A9E8LT56_9BACI|nr:TetR/AcrR family transcriptional regulator [Fervidibacillus albus]WAA09148.1 TetR/AcrR family transcriptional regulator [Fervidibacillus albus]